VDDRISQGIPKKLSFVESGSLTL